MGIGLATGMGYVGYVVVFIRGSCLLLMLYTVPFGERRKTSEQELKITIPEDLDYPQLFDDIFENLLIQPSWIRYAQQPWVVSTSYAIT